MHNKRALLCQIATVAFSFVAIISVIAGIEFATIISATISTILGAISAVFVWKIKEARQYKTTKPSEMHKDSIAPAAEHKKSESLDASVNKESATSNEPNIEESHFDEESGLLSNSFFPVYLDQRITAARRTLRPVSLVIFELDGLDKNDSHSPSDRNFYISAVGDVVKRTLRESDCAFRVDNNVFAAVMDDTTESGAVWAAERVRGVLHTGALAGRVTVSAGVACYPSHCLETNDLIESATKALHTAKARGVDQVEIAAEK